MREGMYYRLSALGEREVPWWTVEMKELRERLSTIPVRATKVQNIDSNNYISVLQSINALWLGEWEEYVATTGVASEFRCGDLYVTPSSPENVRVWGPKTRGCKTALKLIRTDKTWLALTGHSQMIQTVDRPTLASCSLCGKALVSPSPENRGYCPTCYAKATALCHVTGVRLFKTDMKQVDSHWYSAGNEPKLCNCSRCGSRGIESDFRKTGTMDGTIVLLCSSCARGSIAPYHVRPPQGLIFHSDRGVSRHADSQAVYIGAEIETTNRNGEYHAASLMLLANDIKHSLYFQNYDGSLRGAGFEWITMPMTIGVWEAKKELYRGLFAKLVSMGMRAHDTDECGLHFHVSRTGLGGQAIEDLFVLFERNFPEFLQFSRRTTDEHFLWSSRLLRGNNNDMAPYDHEKDLGRTSIKVAMRMSPRGAINLNNHDTVEFRMFKGTLNFNTFWASLTLVNACVRYVKEARIRMEDTTFEMLIDYAQDENLRTYWDSRKAQPQYVRVTESA